MTAGNQHSGKKTILLVEDEALLAFDRKMLLESHGYSVIHVLHGEGAVEAVSDSCVDLILMDIDLGKDRMSGPEAAEEILQRCEVPIIFHTSHAEREMVDKVKGITRYGYVLKDSGEFVLLEAIQMAFELFQAHQALLAEQKERKQNENKYHSLFEQAADALFIYNYETDEIVEVNQRACELLGYTKAELLSMSVSDLQAPETRGEKGATIKNELEMYRGRLFEAVDIHKDGYSVPVEVSTSYLKGVGGPLVLSISRDMTEQKKVEEALAESEERLRTAMEAVNEGLLDWRLDTGEAYFSSGCYTMLGCTEGEFIPGFENFKALVHPDDLPMVLEKIDKTIKEGKWYENIFRMQAKHGGWVWIEAKGRAVEYDSEGNPVRVVGTHNDITRQKDLEDMLRGSEKRYRHIYQNTLSSIWEEDFEELHEEIDRLKDAGVTDFKAYLDAHPESVMNMARYITGTPSRRISGLKSRKPWVCV